MDILATIQNVLPPLLEGTVVTIQVTLLATILAFFVAFIAGFGRVSKYRVVRVGTIAFVEFFRGTSLLVQLFWIYFALPIFGIELPKLLAGVLALGLNYGAYGSEVVRSAIQAIPKGQTEAGVALNMTTWQRMRYIILPQALAIMLPGFGNLNIELLKGTSLVSLITLTDLAYQGTLLRTASIKDTPIIFLLTLGIYFVLAYTITLGIRWLERKTAEGRA